VVKSVLAKLPPEAPIQTDKAFLMTDLPLINEDNRIENKRQLDRLHMRLAHTLTLFKRKAVVELILLRRASTQFGQWKNLA
jgi:hypothetical protein